jgi:hypothetical protein
VRHIPARTKRIEDLTLRYWDALYRTAFYLAGSHDAANLTKDFPQGVPDR